MNGEKTKKVTEYTISIPSDVIDKLKEIGNLVRQIEQAMEEVRVNTLRSRIVKLFDE